MATPVNVFGSGLIQCSFISGTGPVTYGNPADLGYTENGIDIEERQFTLPVYSDENGGQAGMPFDYQVLGEQHVIRLSVSRFDDAVLKTMWQPWLVPPSAGFSVTPGSLVYQDLGYFRLAFGNNFKGIVYPKCTLVSEPLTRNKGTRHEIATFTVLAQPARIATTVSQVTTLTWKTYYEAASLALAWANLSGLTYT